MASATSTSTGRKLLPVINDKCALRRNLAVQPYGRCSVCTLEIQQCHAWQSSALSFALVALILAPLFVGDPWVVRGAVAGALGLLLLQGMNHHRRTDELIFGQHALSQATGELRAANVELERARHGLEEQVAQRTENLRAANVALARANLELAELARRREQMVLEVSHDLRTPLTSVKGAADNLLDGIAGPLAASQREYVEIVRDHAARLIGGVTELLRATREEHVDVTLDLAPVDLAALARDVVKSLRPIAGDRGVKLDVRGGEAVTLADADKLRKVLENLVGNALKFTDAGGAVVVDVSKGEDELRVTVEDTGVGMTPAEVERAFDRYYRGAGDAAGAGLGLAITRDLVRLHGGDVLARSEAGRGSAFSAVFPVRAA
jgi:signal transduction histidine kinase